MRLINYSNKEDRKINGMYFVFTGYSENAKNYEQDSDGISIVFSPKLYPVAPALDYLRYKKNLHGKDRLNKEAKAICHWYNFLRLHGLTGKEKVTTNTLVSYIEFLAVIPKYLNNRIKVHPSELSSLPVHPYIKGAESEDTVKKIYKEWFESSFSKFKTTKNQTVSPFFRPNNVRVETDAQAWSYSYEQISEFLKCTLEYLWWLGESEKWSHFFQPLHDNVASRSIAMNEHNNQPYVLWEGYPSITKHTKLKPRPIRSVRGERIFFENELRSFLKDETFLNQESERKYQRKFFFVLLLLTGMRVSECLNLLIKDIRVTLPNDSERYNPFSERTIVHWEDMFTDKRMELDRMDVRIDEYLGFIIGIQKRDGKNGTFLYESKRRKNKSSTSRTTKLKDIFSLPELLGLDCKSIFVTPEDFYKLFKDEIIQKEMEGNPYKLVGETIKYYLDVKQRHNGKVDLSHPEFELEHHNRIRKIRSLIDNSWFGRLMRNYLIERNLMQVEKKNTGKNMHYLFVNPETKNLGPYEPQTPLKWLKYICKNQGIKRSFEEEWGGIVGHKIKNSLTLHSFRHTYISARIGLEQRENRYQPANLKKEVGHVNNSKVTETVYYWLEQDLASKAQTALFRFMAENIQHISLKEEDEQNEFVAHTAVDVD